LPYIQRIQEQIKQQPNSKRLYTILGRLYQKTGEMVLAHQAYKKALSIDPHYTHALVGLARLTLHQNNPNEARKLLEQVLKQDPSHASALAEQSELFRMMAMREKDSERRLKLFQQAVYNLQRALERQPKNHAYHYRLGILYLAQRDYFKSHTQFSTAHALFKAHPCYKLGSNISEALLTQRRSAYLQSTKWLPSCQHSLMSRISQPVIMAWHIQRAQAMSNRGSFKKAIKIMRRAIDAAPDEASGYLYLAVLYAQNQNCVHARKILQTLLKIQPQHTVAQKLLQQPDLLECSKPKRSSTSTHIQILEINKSPSGVDNTKREPPLDTKTPSRNNQISTPQTPISPSQKPSNRKGK
jgi:cytochrome c-type biogenesis protein CcmH/NrfG